MKLALPVLGAALGCLCVFGSPYLPIPLQVGIDALFILLWGHCLARSTQEHGAMSLDTLLAALCFISYTFATVVYYCGGA